MGRWLRPYAARCALSQWQALVWRLDPIRTQDDPRVSVFVEGGLDAENDPVGFRVQTGDGFEYFYGTTADSRVLGRPMLPNTNTYPATWSQADRDHIWAWSLSAVRDSLGHEVTYQYRTVPVGGDRPGLEHDLSAITYGPFRVEFQYQTAVRPDPLERYHRGLLIFQRQLLEEIRVLRGSAVVGRTRLTYEPSLSTGRSRVSAVEQCDRTVCKAPLRFTWQDQPKDYQTGTILQIPSSTGFVNEDTFALTAADLNNDGFDDLLVRIRRSDNTDRWFYSLSDGFGYSTLVLLEIPEGLMPAGATDRERQWRRMRSVLTTDVDADGVVDRASSCRTGTGSPLWHGRRRQDDPVRPARLHRGFEWRRPARFHQRGRDVVSNPEFPRKFGVLPDTLFVRFRFRQSHRRLLCRHRWRFGCGVSSPASERSGRGCERHSRSPYAGHRTSQRNLGRWFHARLRDAELARRPQRRWPY